MYCYILRYYVLPNVPTSRVYNSMQGMMVAYLVLPITTTAAHSRVHDTVSATYHYNVPLHTTNVLLVHTTRGY